MVFRNTASTQVPAMMNAAQYLANAFDKEKGDFKLICQGKVFTAHSFILSERSGCFKTALETNVGEVKKEMDINAVVEECIPEVLSCAINFLYGQNIPADFNHGHCLFKTADAFLMEDLKDAVSKFFSQRLNMNNVKDVARSADMYHSPRLLEECHNLVLANIGTVGNEELKEVALAMPSIAEKALQSMKEQKKEIEAMKETAKEQKRKIDVMRETSTKQINKIRAMAEFENHIFGTTAVDVKYRSKEEFDSFLDYAMYVEENIQKDMLVKVNVDYAGLSKGDIGRVVSKAGDDSFVQVKWVKSMRTIMGFMRLSHFHFLDLITPPIPSFLKAISEKE